MKPTDFAYHAPGSLEEAASLLAELGEGAKLLAGGQSLIPMLALRLTAFDHLIDIGGISELKGIRAEEDHVRVGAGTTEAEVGRSDEIATRVPLLTRATRLIGHFQIRNRGTIGGSVAHADPAAEYPAVVLALDAELDVVSLRGSRTLPAHEFFSGLWTTRLEPDEILAGIRFPIWPGRCGFAVEEIARRQGDFAIAGATVAVQLDGNGVITRSAIGLIGLDSTPVRASAAEREMVGVQAAYVDTDAVSRSALADLQNLPTDLHGSADYRRRVGAVMVARALRSAIREAQVA